MDKIPFFDEKIDTNTNFEKMVKNTIGIRILRMCISDTHFQNTYHVERKNICDTHSQDGYLSIIWNPDGIFGYCFQKWYSSHLIVKMCYFCQ